MTLKFWNFLVIYEWVILELNSEKLYLSDFDVCVTVHHWYNNINSQLDATIVTLLKIFNQLYMFRAIISPILRSTRLPAGSIVSALHHKVSPQSKAPEDGRNYRPKHIELIENF